MVFQKIETLNNSNNNNSVVLRIIIVGIAIVSVALLFTNHTRNVEIFASLTSILMSAYYIWVVKQNWPLLIIACFIMVCVWSFILPMYLGVWVDSPYMQFLGSEVAYSGLIVVQLFLISIILLTPYSVTDFSKQSEQMMKKNKSTLLVVLLGIAVLVLGVFGVGDLAYEGGSRFEISSFYEYSVILYLLALYYSGNNKGLLIYLSIIGAFRVIEDFSIGSRIVAVEFASAYLLMTLSFRFTKSKIFALLIVLFVAVLTVGELRGQAFSFDAVFRGVNDLISSGFAWEGAYSAYHTSLTFVAYSDTINWNERLNAFYSFCLSIFFGGSVPGSILANETRSIFWSMGGGYYPFHFYYYFGYFGVVLFSLFLGLILRKVALWSIGSRYEFFSDFKFLLIIWIAVSSFRWFQYLPMILFRGALILFAIYGIVFLFHRWQKRRGLES